MVVASPGPLLPAKHHCEGRQKGCPNKTPLIFPFGRNRNSLHHHHLAYVGLVFRVVARNFKLKRYCFETTRRRGMYQKSPRLGGMNIIPDHLDDARERRLRARYGQTRSLATDPPRSCPCNPPCPIRAGTRISRRPHLRSLLRIRLLRCRPPTNRRMTRSTTLNLERPRSSCRPARYHQRSRPSTSRPHHGHLLESWPSRHPEAARLW
jgi:hypothetical protein